MLVKKYSNRRLYDTESSRYITLDELAQKIQAGSDARVIDAKSNADLTQVTLTQIILESRRGAQLLPVPLLLSLIRMKDDALADFLGRYVTWALELYMHARQGVHAVSTMSPLASLAMQTNPLARLLFGGGGLGFGADPTAMRAGAGFGPDAAMGPPPMSAPSAVTSSPAPPPPPSSDDVAALRREIEELRQSLIKPSSKPRKKRSAG
jgi:polyhydroxyalkanoate synthesis repressor PhaR